MSGEGGAIAEVLAAHLIGYEPRAYPAYVCYCGWDGARGDDGSETDGQYDNADGANEHIATALLASPALADLLAAERQRGRAEALRVVRQVESDMGEQAYEAWRSADARRGLSDHDALLVHADALTRWSERFRMAFDGDYYAAGGDE